MSVSFRPFIPADEPEIIKMCLSLYAEDTGAYTMTVEKINSTIQQWKDFPEKGNIIVFEVNKHLIGYANLIYYWSNEYGGNIIILDEIFVKKDYRNKGVTTRFIQEFHHIFDKPVAGYELQVHTGNDNAMRLYQRLGFTKNPNTFMLKLKSL